TYDRDRWDHSSRRSLMWAFLVGTLLLHVYPSMGEISSHARRWKRALRGTTSRHEQPMTLPASTWRDWTPARRVAVVAREKRNGNVHKGELAVLSAFAAAVPMGGRIFEIGTFDGRTTANLALAAPVSAIVHTLDLPDTDADFLGVARGEAHRVRKRTSGVRYRTIQQQHGSNMAAITQHLGDSATFPWEEYRDAVDLLVVDGSHALEYALLGSADALIAARIGGVIVWHDYGIRPGVTEALDRLRRDLDMPLRRIRGTSLVALRVSPDHKKVQWPADIIALLNQCRLSAALNLGKPPNLLSAKHPIVPKPPRECHTELGVMMPEAFDPGSVIDNHSRGFLSIFRPEARSRPGVAHHLASPSEPSISLKSFARTIIPPTLGWFSSHLRRGCWRDAVALRDVNFAARRGDTAWPQRLRSWLRDADVLDVGCGRNLQGLGFLAAGARSYTGIEPALDLDSNLFKDSRSTWGRKVPTHLTLRALMQRHPALRYERAFAGNLAAREPSSFDVLVMHNVTEHLMQIEAEFEQFARLLRPGGVILFRHPNFYCWHGHHRRPRTVSEMDGSTEQAEVVDWAHVRFDPEKHAWIARTQNRIRLGELRGVVERHFHIELWEANETSPEQGRDRLTPEILARYPEFTRQELLTRAVFIAARSKRAGDRVDRLAQINPTQTFACSAARSFSDTPPLQG
ncbi:MAG: class I SAM-dependent methyltransferase, partial [Prosthecobacter sp.]|nr:class I SAM-dependent methyltransferase [Prosthecobacter sp.]